MVLAFSLNSCASLSLCKIYILILSFSCTNSSSYASVFFCLSSSALWVSLSSSSRFMRSPCWIRTLSFSSMQRAFSDSALFFSFSNWAAWPFRTSFSVETWCLFSSRSFRSLLRFCKDLVSSYSSSLSLLIWAFKSLIIASISSELCFALRRAVFLSEIPSSRWLDYFSLSLISFSTWINC